MKKQRFTIYSSRVTNRAIFLKPKPPTGPDPIKVDQYRGHGTSFNRDGARCSGSLSIPVLHFLWGRKLDEVVIGFINGLRPSSIRISDGTIHCDARRWRVTVIIDKDDFCKQISQEIEVLLPNGVQHGNALRIASMRGIDSPEIKWHGDAESYFSGLSGYGKINTKGKAVKWPFRALKRARNLWKKPYGKPASLRD